MRYVFNGMPSEIGKQTCDNRRGLRLDVAEAILRIAARYRLVTGGTGGPRLHLHE